MTQRIIVAGSRGFTDYDLLCKTLDQHFGSQSDIAIVSGTARGADQLGERYAAERGLECHRYPADWKKYGRRAGYRRNELMAANADALVAFWDGESRGTEHMIEHARQLGMPVHVVMSASSRTID